MLVWSRGVTETCMQGSMQPICQHDLFQLYALTAKGSCGDCETML